jgi:hypothetical protein
LIVKVLEQLEVEPHLGQYLSRVGAETAEDDRNTERCSDPHRSGRQASR